MQTGQWAHILIPDNGCWYYVSHWHTGMKHPPTQWPSRRLSGELTTAVVQASVEAKPMQRGPAAIPRMSVIQQRGQLQPIILPTSGLLHTHRNLPNLQSIILRGMQRGGTEIVDVCPEAIYLILCVMVVHGQDYVQDDYCWKFWWHGSLWALLAEMSAQSGPVTWPVGGNGGIGRLMAKPVMKGCVCIHDKTDFPNLWHTIL